MFGAPAECDGPCSPCGEPAADVDPCQLDHRQRLNVFQHIEELCTRSSATTSVDTPPFYTVFHSTTVPSFPLNHYNEVIKQRLGLGRPCVSIALVLMHRYWALSGCLPSQLTMHRLFAAAMLVAMKMYHDHVWKNNAFATACGLEAAEVNRLELALLRSMDWNSLVTATDVERLVGSILRADNESACRDPPAFGLLPAPSVAAVEMQ